MVFYNPLQICLQNTILNKTSAGNINVNIEWTL